MKYSEILLSVRDSLDELNQRVGTYESDIELLRGIHDTLDRAYTFLCTLVKTNADGLPATEFDEKIMSLGREICLQMQEIAEREARHG